MEVLNSLREVVHVAHSPQSNMNNGVGYTPVNQFSAVPLLGTDGMGANMWNESHTAQFKSHDAGRPVPFGHPLRMLASSARFASRQLGVSLGLLRQGAAADLVLTDYVPATPLSANNLADHFLYAMSSECVRDVMINGQWKMRQRYITACNEIDVRKRTAEVARSLHDRMATFPVYP